MPQSWCIREFHNIYSGHKCTSLW